MNPVALIGRAIIHLAQEVGRAALFLKDALVHGLWPPFYPRLLLTQMMRIGYNSLPVVGLTAFFTGGVLALQIYVGGSRFNAESMVAQIVAIGIVRELGPVLAGLMFFPVKSRNLLSVAMPMGMGRLPSQMWYF